MIAVVLCVDTCSRTSDLSCRTRRNTRASGTQFTARTNIVAAPAMLTIRCGLDARPTAICQTRRTSTPPRKANFPTCTCDSAASAMFVVRLIRDTRTVALGLSAWTRDHTGSSNAQTPRSTGIVTRPTMSAPCHRIHTRASTIGQTARTSTRSRDTLLSARTNHTATTAMIVVALLADTRTAAIALAARARNHTRATGTHPPRRANLIASPTMLTAGVGINADPVAVGLAAWTCAYARNTAFSV